VVVDFAEAAGQTITLLNKLESGKLGVVMQFRVASGTVVDTSNPLAPGTRLMAPDLFERFTALRALGAEFLAAQARGSAQHRLRGAPFPLGARQWRLSDQQTVL
jgi:hypothetical protein